MYFNTDEPYVSEKTLNDLPEAKKEYKRKIRKKRLFDIIFYGLLLFFLVYLIPVYIAERIIIQGTSMEPTLYNNESVLIEKISVVANSIDRYDVIVFAPKGDETKNYIVKRVIGLPGETIQIISGKIYINNNIIEDIYAKESIEMKAGNAAEPIYLRAGEYFVLGDNREVSSDSRSSLVGIVEFEQIVGVVKAVILPISKFRIVK